MFRTTNMAMFFRSAHRFLARFSADYGMLFILLLLCAYYSYVTCGDHHPADAGAGADLADHIAQQFGQDARVLILVRNNREEGEFADALCDRLTADHCRVAAVVKGDPPDGLAALRAIAGRGGRLDVIACTYYTSQWSIFSKVPSLATTPIVAPPSYRWSTFLQARNLLNITGQIAVIAIVAAGMTLVIIAGGIDLSVGSLIALSAVVSTKLIEAQGGTSASAGAVVVSCIIGISVCALTGIFSGLLITLFRIPSFIMTLAVMQVASGLAFRLAKGESVYHVPPFFGWLGLGADFFRIPNSAMLMVLLYVLAHILMTRMTLGRYIYAVGGNVEAARLSGVPVRSVVLFVFGLSGALAGLAGVILSSQLRGGKPDYGQNYELLAIAAVVVGGTSLQGGQGKVLGSLIGAFIIAVIQNGMNLTSVDPYAQKVVLGLVLLGAVLLDMLKKGGWKALSV